MPMKTNAYWQRNEPNLSAMYRAGEWRTDAELAVAFVAAHPGVSVEAARVKVGEMRRAGRLGAVAQSPYPVYDAPLEMEGDALILPDVEAPFHHADFVNRCLDLASAWGIPGVILAGDALHFDNLSGWEPNWTPPQTGGLTADAEAQLLALADNMPAAHAAKLRERVAAIGQRQAADGLGTELAIARQLLHRLADQFERADFVMGNHEGRLLRALQTTLAPADLAALLQLGDKWRVAPYYYSVLTSAGERFQIEHPKNSAKYSAAKLAGKYACHVIMAHNHHLVYQFDPSNRYYAIEAGHCVDESRLPYTAQRHNTGPSHSLGAVIVRAGIPWLLHPRVDWRRLATM